MGDINSITSNLWAMANELRGNMDASEYKNYILAFMFYRYLSEHQEEYLVSNGVIDVRDGESVNDAYKREYNEEKEKDFRAAGVSKMSDEKRKDFENSYVNDYIEDITSTLGYAIEPGDTWASLLEKIEEKELVPSDYQTIFANFDRYAKLNAEAESDFRGVFNDVNLGDSRLGSSTADRAKSLTRIVNLVEDVEYKSEDGRDMLGEIYEYLIGQFAASAGKKGGEFYTPHEVSKILAKVVTDGLTESDNVFNVYDPTCGSGSLLLTVQNEVPGGDKPGAVKFYGQELNTTTYNLARMNLMMHGVSYQNMILSNADTLGPDWPDGLDSKGVDQPRSFDAVVANPPYSAHWDNNENKLKDPRFNDYGKLAPKTKADFSFVLHGLYHLRDEGTMAIVLPHGVLFRGAAEGEIRKNLIEHASGNRIYAVIGLPANLFYGTSIPTIVMVLKKKREGKDILFIDASGEFEKKKNQNKLSEANIEKIIAAYRDRKDIPKYAHLASIEEIRQNDYNLNIPRYVDTAEEEEEIDIAAVRAQLEEDKKEIALLEAKIADQLRLLGL